MVGHNVKPIIKVKEYKKTLPRKRIKKQKVNLRDSDATSSPWMDDYLDCFGFKMKPVSEKFLERFSGELTMWAAKNDDALKISQFYLGKGISATTYYNWRRDHDILSKAHDFAMACIADRREIGAIKRYYDSNMVRFTQPAYDKKWKELEEWRNEMKADINKDNQTKVVVIEKFPSSDLVPDKV